MKKINKIEERLSKYRLRENAIPNHSHGINLRHLLTKTTWDKLRQKIYERDKNQCVICGDKSPTKLHCHEEFSFDYKNKIQKLAKLMTLCPRCHGNKHIIPKSKILTEDSMKRLIAHWFMVNYSKNVYFYLSFLKRFNKKMWKYWEEYIASVLSIATERNTIAWKIDLNQNKIEKICENFNIEMKFKSKENPTEINDIYWIYAKNKDFSLTPKEFVIKKHNLDNPIKSGKWLIFISPININKVWEKIKQATEKGILGDISKVSTAKPNPNSKSNAYVICVYTTDYEDINDVMRIRKELRNLGINRKIPYKTDITTLKKKYGKGTSLYYE